jgi:hypothetical protein
LASESLVNDQPEKVKAFGVCESFERFFLNLGNRQTLRAFSSSNKLSACSLNLQVSKEHKLRQIDFHEDFDQLVAISSDT